METLLDRIDFLISEKYGKKHGRIALFSRLTGINDGTIRSWFRKNAEALSFDNVEKICNATGVTPGWLLTGQDPKYEKKGEKRTIPIIPWHAINEWWEGGFKMNGLSAGLTVDGGIGARAFAFEAPENYDCMTPTVQPGYLVIVDPDMQPQEGSIVLALDNEGHAHLGRFRPEEARNRLSFDNPGYSLMLFGRTLKLIGVAVQVRFSLL